MALVQHLVDVSSVSEGALIPIRTVSALTGIKPATIRVWEHRYGLVNPQRSESGHRLYTQGDVTKLRQTQLLLEKGLNLRQISQWLAHGDAVSRDESTDEADGFENHRLALIDAVSSFDEPTLSRCYNRILGVYPLDIVTKQIVVPLLAHFGSRWAETSSGIAEEHFFTNFLRNKLGAQFHHRHTVNGGPSLLLACLPGERHEIGLLLFANYMLDHDFRVSVLGVDMPLDETARVARQSGSSAIVLSATNLSSLAKSLEDLSSLAKDVGVPVFVGGAATNRFALQIQRCGAIPVGADLKHGWLAIRQHLHDAVGS